MPTVPQRAPVQRLVSVRDGVRQAHIETLLGPEYLGIPEAAACIGIPIKTAHAWIRAGYLRAERAGIYGRRVAVTTALRHKRVIAMQRRYTRRRPYRMLSLSARPAIPRAQREKIIAIYACTCAYCGESSASSQIGPDGRTWHIDHIIPLARGGHHTPENWALACGTCNNKKWANFPPDGVKSYHRSEVLHEAHSEHAVIMSGT